jgi:uncharacterized RDD family membrane protein YckC
MTPAPPPPPEQRPAYAGLVTRTVAFFSDLVVINAIAFAVGIAVGLVASVVSSNDVTVGVGEVLAAVGGLSLLAAVYLVAFWTLLGQTPGMWLMRLAVVPVNGGRMRVARSVRRLVGLVLAALPLGAGLLWMLVDDRRQGLQDKVAGTFVVYAPRGAGAP